MAAGLLSLTVSWGGDPEDLLIVEEGVSDDEPVALFRDVLADERYRPDLLILVDARLSDYTRVSWNVIGQRVDSLYAATGDAPDLRVAAVVGTAVDFGLWRTWGSMVEARVGAHVYVADTLDDARDWLRTQRRLRSDAAS